MLFKIAHRYLEPTGFGCTINDKSLVNLFQKNYTDPNSAGGDDTDESKWRQ